MNPLDNYNKKNECIAHQAFYLLGSLESCLDFYDNGDVSFDFVIKILRDNLKDLKDVCDNY